MKDIACEISCYEQLPFDLEEAKRNNTLVTATNSMGKSRLAMAICSMLQRLQWKIILVDNSGVWKQRSDIPRFYQVKPIRTVKDMFQQIPIPIESTIYDISLLKPSEQRQFIESLLQYIWESRVNTIPNQWLLLVLEESHLYMKNVRGLASEELLRLMSVGRNIKVRVLGISIDLALIDPSFIRLCQQRFHGKLGIEENSKRKFKAYYGKDYTRIACEGLDVGDFLYVLNDKVKVVSVPLFESTSKPIAFIPAKPKGIIERLRRLIRW